MWSNVRVGANIFLPCSYPFLLGVFLGWRAASDLAQPLCSATLQPGIALDMSCCAWQDKTTMTLRHLRTWCALRIEKLGFRTPNVASIVVEGSGVPSHWSFGPGRLQSRVLCHSSISVDFNGWSSPFFADSRYSYAHIAFGSMVASALNIVTWTEHRTALTLRSTHLAVH